MISLSPKLSATEAKRRLRARNRDAGLCACGGELEPEHRSCRLCRDRRRLAKPAHVEWCMECFAFVHRPSCPLRSPFQIRIDKGQK